jgi:hypothetical protein
MYFYKYILELKNDLFYYEITGKRIVQSPHGHIFVVFIQWGVLGYTRDSYSETEQYAYQE